MMPRTPKLTNLVIERLCVKVRKSSWTQQPPNNHQIHTWATMVLQVVNNKMQYADMPCHRLQDTTHAWTNHQLLLSTTLWRDTIMIRSEMINILSHLDDISPLLQPSSVAMDGYYRLFDLHSFEELSSTFMEDNPFGFQATIEFTVPMNDNGLSVMLETMKNHLYITRILRSVSLHHSGLQIDDELIEVQHKNMDGWSRKKLDALLQTIRSGEDIQIRVFRSRTMQDDTVEDIEAFQKECIEPEPESGTRTLTVGLYPHNDIMLHLPEEHVVIEMPEAIIEKRVSVGMPEAMKKKSVSFREKPVIIEIHTDPSNNSRRERRMCKFWCKLGVCLGVTVLIGAAGWLMWNYGLL
ncbi:uncharacterized protein [Hyperolius riggenbachi]|uniref:uncharacterized protein isoform X2 n=1 Tax=Hyperolius riggenbachi TaxID=752182 RepID=UPI0035A295E6